MPERDRTTIDVKSGRITSDGLKPCERYGREGLIHFVQIDLVDTQTRPLERRLYRVEELINAGWL